MLLQAKNLPGLDQGVEVIKVTGMVPLDPAVWLPGCSLFSCLCCPGRCIQIPDTASSHC